MMNNEPIKIVCNICNENVFITIKPKIKLHTSHNYFTCTECLIKKRRESTKLCKTHAQDKK